jgi:hypothetical protein
MAAFARRDGLLSRTDKRTLAGVGYSAECVAQALLNLGLLLSHGRLP